MSWRRRAAWAAVALLLGVTIYAIAHERLFAQYLWTPEGAQRLVAFAAGFWIAAGLLIRLRPQWLAPATGAVVFLYSLWWCASFFNPVAPLAVLYFMGSCLLLGKRVARHCDGITAMLLGLAIWIFVIAHAVHYPVNTPLVYAIAFALPYALEGKQLGESARAFRLPQVGRSDAAGLALLLFVLLLHWLVVLKPEVSSDGLAMHLTVPMAVARDARWSFDFSRYTWALMPMGGDWAFTGVYLLGGEAAARLLNFALLAAIAAMIYRAARKWLAPGPASVAAALFVSTPLVQLVTGALFVENLYAAMVLGGALALVNGEIVVGCALFGAALSAKVGTLVFLAPVALLVAFSKVGWKKVAVALVAFAALAAPPYMNAWRTTGNPVFPFANKTFKSPYMETANDIEDVRFHETFTWKTPYETTFRSMKFFESQNGSLGFQYFLLLAPALLLWNRRAPWKLSLLAAVAAVLIFSTIPNLRYLYPALPLLSIAIAWLLAEMPSLVGLAVIVTLLNVWFLPASNWYHQEFALVNAQEFDDYLTRSAPQRWLIDDLNRRAPGEPVAFFSGSPVAGLIGRGYTDQWHTFEFWKKMTRAGSPEEIAALFRTLGIKHAIAPDPVDTNYPVVRRFVQDWTQPTGVRRGRFAIRDISGAASQVERPRTLAGPGAYDDVDAKIEYQGAWTQDRQFRQPWEHSITYSNQPGAALRFYFEGGTLTYIYTKAFNRGVAEVSVDGRQLAPVDLYAPQIQWRAQTTYRDLGKGQHTVEIRVSGRKADKATDVFVDLDRFAVGD